MRRGTEQHLEWTEIHISTNSGLLAVYFLSRTNRSTMSLRGVIAPIASSSKHIFRRPACRSFGFVSTSPAPTAVADPVSHPAVHGTLVPIVVEQTVRVSCRAISLALKGDTVGPSLISRPEASGAMISTLDFCANESSFSVPYVAPPPPLLGNTPLTRRYPTHRPRSSLRNSYFSKRKMPSAPSNCTSTLRGGP